MKNYEIHLYCIYQHKNGSICCVENIVGEDIYVNSTSGDLWCFASELVPLKLDREIFDFITTITNNVNCVSICCAGELKRLIMQHITQDAYIDHIFFPKYVHEAQLFIQLSRYEDIHEQLFNYLLTR